MIWLVFVFIVTTSLQVALVRVSIENKRFYAPGGQIVLILLNLALALAIYDDRGLLGVF